MEFERAKRIAVFLAASQIFIITVPHLSATAFPVSNHTGDSLLAAEYAAGCLEAETPCDRAVRLKRFATWLGEKKEPCSTLVREVVERSATLQDTLHYTIDTSIVTFVGQSSAPVRIIMYVSASCPLCKRIYAALYDSVVTGGLKGKARLGIKPFSSKPWDVALLASRDFGKQAELMCSLAGVTERISMPIIIRKADSLGIPREAFMGKINGTRLKADADASYREATRNGVTITPTLFINNCRYKSYKDPRWVVDAVEYFHEKGKLKR
jgi:glutaredoxin